MKIFIEIAGEFLFLEREYKINYNIISHLPTGAGIRIQFN